MRTVTARWWALCAVMATALALPGAQEPSDSLHAPVGLLAGDSLGRLGVTQEDRRAAGAHPSIRYSGMTKFLNQARTAVTATFDDSNAAVPATIDALDKHGVKATIAVSTQSGPIADLWPRLRAAVESGHEIGSHSRRHLCQWPDTQTFCRSAYQVVREHTVVTPIGPRGGWERFAVHNALDPNVYDNAVTLSFQIPPERTVAVRTGGRPIVEDDTKRTDRWNKEYHRREGPSTFVTVRPNQIVELRVDE